MRIHFIAIGGAIMHSLAIQLKRQGHIVTGSDDVIYEPARSNLLKNNLLPKQEGWDVSRISDVIDLILVGMHAKLDNPELLMAQKLNLKLLSFPEYIFNYSINKKRIVIAGSHGKTTITSMILHVLHDNNMEVDFLLGAKIDSLDNLVYLNDNKIIIIEGDEYFSSPLDNTSKFMHYKADILVVSGVEWDHVNVFPTFELYKNNFSSLINNVIATSGTIFYCGDDVFLSKKLNNQRGSIRAYYLPNYRVNDNQFIVESDDSDIPLHIFGKHNLYNLEAAKLVCQDLGVSIEKFNKSIQSFKGADKRLTLIKKNENNSAIYYDFAHSPSKVYATINAIRELYPKRYLIACFQLNTFSSLNPDFLPQYSNVFNNADEIWIYLDKESVKANDIDYLNASYLKKVTNHKKLIFINQKLDIKDKLESFVMKDNNLLIMSSGNFSGINIKRIFADH